MKRLLLISAMSTVAWLSIVAAAPPTANPRPSPAVQAPPSAVAHQGQSKRLYRSRLPRPISEVAVANRAATVRPAAHGFVNATQVYPFSDGLLFQVYTAPGRITDIALQAGEVLVSVASGDTARWVIGDTTSGSGGDKRTHVLIKPFTVGIETNLVITTDRRSYHLALTSTSGAAMAAMSWIYPHDELLALKRAAARADADLPIASGLEIDRLRFDYAITGDRPAWRPLRAFDDGRQTFIEFPATLAVGEAPPLFLVDRDGSAQLVNYRLRGRFYIVDRLFDAAELRLGTKRQQIVRIARAGSKPGRVS